MNNKVECKSTIMIVENDKRLLDMFSEGFSNQGFQIYKAGNSREALLTLEKTIPDIILSDMNISDFSGRELFIEVKRKFGNHRPLFMLLSAQSSELEILESLRIGIDDVISKPFSLKQLILKISNHSIRIREQKRQKTCCLAGKLCDQGLADLIQFLELVEHSGTLTITHQHREGIVIFKSGRVLNADFSPLKGRNAVYAMMALEDGHFCFNKHPINSNENTIGVDNYALILDGLKMMDELGRDTMIRALHSGNTSSPFPETIAPSPSEHRSEHSTEAVSASPPSANEISHQSQDHQAPSLSSLNIINYPEWIDQCLQISDELKEINPGSIPVRHMKESQFYTSFLRLHHPMMIPIIGSGSILDAIFGSLSHSYHPRSPDFTPATVARISLRSLGVLYLMGMSLSQVTTIPERIGINNLPGVFWLDDEGIDYIKTISTTWTHPVRIIISPDPSRLLLDTLEEKDSRWVRTIKAAYPTPHNTIVILRKIFKLLSECNKT